MFSKLRMVWVALMMLLLTACATTKGDIYDYSALQQSKPRSILLVMPTNQSMEIKGPNAVLAHAVRPLTEAGYYVFAPALVNDTFIHNGVYQAEEIAQIPHARLKEIFGSDTALYLDVTAYGTNYQVIQSATSVGVSAKLVDLATSRTLWERSALHTEVAGSSGGNIFVMLLSAAANQIVDTASDKAYGVAAVTDANLFNQNCNNCLLYGPYSANYGKDAQLHKEK